MPLAATDIERCALDEACPVSPQEFSSKLQREGLMVGLSSHSVVLLSMASAAIAILIVLISVVKLHPFVSLVVVSLGLGLAVGMKPAALAQTFEEGVGFTLGHVAVVIALGTILGKMMAESGGADEIARTLVNVAGKRGIPWAMLAVGIVTGLPVFFEVGFVLMIPIAFTVARRSGSSIVLVALPLVAGLSVVHAFCAAASGSDGRGDSISGEHRKDARLCAGDRCARSGFSRAAVCDVHRATHWSGGR